MYIVSNVMDHYRPQFEPYRRDTTPTSTFTITQSVDLVELARLIEDFKEAVAAAKKLDVLTKQPDCEDPEKAKLVARVADLEKQLEAVREAAAPPAGKDGVR